MATPTVSEGSPTSAELLDSAQKLEAILDVSASLHNYVFSGPEEQVHAGGDTTVYAKSRGGSSQRNFFILATILPESLTTFRYQAQTYVDRDNVGTEDPQIGH